MATLGFGSSNSWNYNDPNKDGYINDITGTLVEINETQKINYQTREKEFWPEGNPKLNLRFCILANNGVEYPWVFQPSKSTAADAVAMAMETNGLDPKNISSLLGLTVRVATNEDRAPYGSRNPRPWYFQILGAGTAPARGCYQFRDTPEGKMFYQQQQQQYNGQQAPPIVNGYFAAPTAQPAQQPMAQPMQQPMQRQVPMQQPMTQPVPMQQPMAQPMQQPMQQPVMQQQVPMQQPMAQQQPQVPQGSMMNQAVQQQQFTGVQPSQQAQQMPADPAAIYDEEIPF